MMNKLLKITEITTLPKSAQFPNYQRYNLIAQIEDLNEDCDMIYYIEKRNEKTLDNFWEDNYCWKSKSKSLSIIFTKKVIFIFFMEKKIYVE